MNKYVIFILFLIVVNKSLGQTRNILEASHEGNLKEVVNAIARGEDVDTTTNEGVSPLMYASSGGNIEIVKILVQKGAEINKVPNNGITALLSAVISNQIDIVDFLIQKGANIKTATKKYGLTPLILAVRNNSLEMVDILHFYGAYIDEVDIKGSSPAHVASYYNYLDILDLLYGKGANLNLTENKGNTPLMVAVNQNNYDVCKYLIGKKVNLDVKNIAGFTALALASMKGYDDIVQLLLENNTSLNYPDKRLNPFNLAKNNGHKSTLEILNKYFNTKNYLPNISGLIVGYGVNFNLDDALFGLFIGLRENIYNLDLKFGFDSRYWRNRILIEKSDIYWQVWEMRYAWNLSLEKKINVKENNFEKLGLFIGAKELFTYGNYKGMNKKPQTKFIFSPFIGTFYKIRSLEFKLGYQYLDCMDISPHRVNISIDYYINLSKTTNYKDINYSYLD